MWRVQMQCDSRGVLRGQENGAVEAWGLQWGSSGAAPAMSDQPEAPGRNASHLLLAQALDRRALGACVG